ncbi:hypothetical protein [Methylobacterium nigriterrae]|uniref:hypothetical protein n=1 Tax=Methylobacterium nigriterrae TaxID=3127512 RepID=UPI00301401F1
MINGGDIPAAVIASHPLVQEGLASILCGMGFQVIRADTTSNGSKDPASGQLLPSLILAAPEDDRSVEGLRSLRAACPEARAGPAPLETG